MVTQVEIARRCGLDVSSVNKILNRKPGPVFRKETVRKVFKIARDLGYDFGRLKHSHKRVHARRDVALPLELTIYTADGTLFDRGTAVVKNISLSGALLSALVLPRQSFPLVPHTIGIRLLEGPLKDVEILSRPVRFAPRAEGLDLAVEFLRTEDSKLRALRKIV